MGSTNTDEDIENSCQILCNLTEAKQHISYIMSEPLLKEIFTIAKSDNKMSQRETLRLLVSMYRLKSPPPQPSIPGGFLGVGSSERNNY